MDILFFLLTLPLNESAWFIAFGCSLSGAILRNYIHHEEHENTRRFKKQFFACHLVVFVTFVVKSKNAQTSMSLCSDFLLRQIFELPAHASNITLIRKAEISIVANDQVLVNHHSHYLAGENQLTGNGNIFWRGLRIA